MEGEYNGGIGIREGGIWVCRRIFDKSEEGIWRRGGGVSKGGRVEKVGVGRKNNGGICSGIQEGSKGKWIQGTTIGRKI